MNKKEAIISILEGNKVTFMVEAGKNGKKDHAYYKDGKIYWKFDDDSESPSDVNDWVVDEYFVYQEPKKKVKFYRYLITINVLAQYWISECEKYKLIDDGPIKNHGTDLSGFYKIEGSYIEVEV